MKLYESPEHSNIKLYIDGYTIIFDHLDGMYSYCYFANDKSKVVHINACTEFEKYKDGYKIVDKK